jgi:hypothetical protein
LASESVAAPFNVTPKPALGERVAPRRASRCLSDILTETEFNEPVTFPTHPAWELRLTRNVAQAFENALKTAMGATC